MLTTQLRGAAICCSQAGHGTAPLRHNVGFHVGDDPLSVAKEREALEREVSRPIVWMNQTHSAHVEHVSMTIINGEAAIIDTTGQVLFALKDSATAHVEADGIFLDARGWEHPAPSLAVMTADCLPVIFSDSTGQAVAAVHAGRVGFTNGILLNTLECYARVGIAPEQVSAYIAPSICGGCYEVSAQMCAELGSEYDGLSTTTTWGTPSLDLPEAARRQLLAAGVSSVELSQVCTAENHEYHSYRRDPNSGRQATLVSAAFSA